MSGVWGSNIRFSIFGESHGEAVGIIIDGLEPGFCIDLQKINIEMERRAPGRSSISTPRNETDKFQILSGFFNGRTTGAPLCAIIHNKDQHSADYDETKDLPRPSHADYTGYIKYKGFNDYRGGGHFSGRLTAPLVFAGAVCNQYLDKMGINIGSHIKSIHNTEDENFDTDIDKKLLEELKNSQFPVINSQAGEKMKNAVAMAAAEKNSLGGIIECAIVNVPAGMGEPFFDSIESSLSHLLFSIPGVKGVEFGRGFDITKMKGSEANDEFYMNEGIIKTRTNNNGGVLGGITSGMPVIFRVAIKPTPSIGKAQNTINLETHENESLIVKGRHDPCIVPRAVPVVEAVAAMAFLDIMKSAGR